MKWLKWLLIAVVFLAAVAFLGLLIASDFAKGELHNEVTVEINRPAEQVFSWLVEPEKLTQWIGGLVASTPLTEGGLKVGARSRETVETGGETILMESEILELNRPNLMAIRIGSDSVTVDARYELTERDGATVLTYSADSRFDEFFMRLLSPLISPAIDQKLAEDINRLKTLAEAAPTEP